MCQKARVLGFAFGVGVAWPILKMTDRYNRKAIVRAGLKNRLESWYSFPEWDALPPIKDTGIEKVVKRTLGELAEARSGVSVLLAPNGYGKTERTKQAVRPMIPGSFSNVMHSYLYPVDKDETIARTILRDMGDRVGDFESVEELVGKRDKPFLVVVEDTHQIGSNDDMVGFKELVSRSKEEKQVAYIVLTSSRKRAEQMLLAGATPAASKEEMLETFPLTPKQVLDYINTSENVKLSSDAIEDFVKACSSGASIGHCMHWADSEGDADERARWFREAKFIKEDLEHMSLLEERVAHLKATNTQV